MKDYSIRCELLMVMFITICIPTPTNSKGLQEFSNERVPPFQIDPTMDFTTGGLNLTSLVSIAQLGEGYSLADGSHGQTLESPKGIRRRRMRLMFEGLDIFGASIEAEVDSNGHYTGQMYGYTLKNIPRHIPDADACQQDVSILLNKAIVFEGLSPNNTTIQRSESRRLIFIAPRMKRAKLAYRVEFMYTTEDLISRPVYFFDACTIDIILSFDKALDKFMQNRVQKRFSSVLSYRRRNAKRSEQSDTRVNGDQQQDSHETNCPVFAVGVGGNRKIGRITYNTPPFCLNVQKIGDDLCRMNGKYSKVIDNQQTKSGTKQTVITFPCAEGYKDAINGAYGVANDAMFYGELAFTFLKEKYNIIALPHKPRLVVHYGKRYENAIWDGKDMFFGDSNVEFHPFVDVDTVAHELGHGVVEFHSDLVYMGMSGGINEAFCDILGETTKYFLRGTNDWLIDYDIVKNSAGFEAIRYFEDPTWDGYSIKHVRDYRHRMDVHESSGIFNHAFYSMVVYEGMHIYDAFKCFLDANVNLWKPFTNFFTGACNVMQAAYDNGFDHEIVQRSFQRVGISLKRCKYSALSTSMFVGESRQGILVSVKRSPVLKIGINQETYPSESPLEYFTSTESSSTTAQYHSPSKPASNITVRVEAEHGSSIGITMGYDDIVSNVFAMGHDTITFDTNQNYYYNEYNNNMYFVYVKLTSDSPVDVRVTLRIS